MAKLLQICQIGLQKINSLEAKRELTFVITLAELEVINHPLQEPIHTQRFCFSIHTNPFCTTTPSAPWWELAEPHLHILVHSFTM